MAEIKGSRDATMPPSSPANHQQPAGTHVEAISTIPPHQPQPCTRESLIASPTPVDTFSVRSQPSRSQHAPSIPSASASQDVETDSASATSYEQTHVHSIYDSIAPHFSATRYKPWPFVRQFLSSLPAGSLGYDVGCGNGKNMFVNDRVVILGCDRSEALCKLGKEMIERKEGERTASTMLEVGRGDAKGDDAVNDGGRTGCADILIADSLFPPFRDASADFVICIAVIHHMSTPERRVEAIRELLTCLRPAQISSSSPIDSAATQSKALIYVWALEQSSSRRGWNETSEQDLLVPWVMKAPKHPKQASAKTSGASASSGNIQSSDQHAASGEASVNGELRPQQEDKTFHRYYHLYKEGELEANVLAAGGRVLESGYERDNWWVIAGR